MAHSKLLLPVEEGPVCSHDTKICVVGCGDVGSAVAFSLLTKACLNITFDSSRVLRIPLFSMTLMRIGAMAR